MRKNPGGRPSLYDRPKTRTTISISIEGLEGLDVLANSLDLSRSELVERIGRGELTIVSPSESAQIKSTCPPP
ncbi:ribbon-helix-helix domain-containing protein [Laspinema olomoucense]|uniref:ribbon-helix-helix domain-containing protein n=1 Tax=Laspinema olomoucense TaxID=3231600 RepID=UPI00338FB85B